MWREGERESERERERERERDVQMFKTAAQKPKPCSFKLGGSKCFDL